MSVSVTHNPTRQSSHRRDRRDDTKLYLALIRDTPTVCSTCHERIRDVHQHDTDCLGTGNRPTETFERAGVGVVGQDAINGATVQGVGFEIRQTTGYRARTFCGSCGQPSGRTEQDIPSKRAMLSRVEPLIERFDEADVPLNPDAVRRAVHALRSEPQYRGLETEIWRAAVAVGYRHARIRDALRCSRLSATQP